MDRRGATGQHSAETIAAQQNIVDACDEHQAQIAADLHDAIGSSLAAIKFRLESAIHCLRVERPEVTVAPLRDIASEIGRSMEEVRRIAMNLRPSMLDDLGIVATIGWYCRNLESSYSGVLLTAQISAQEKDIPDFLRMPIFRILQEASNNALKHSGADVIRVTLVKDVNYIRLTLEDNGRGFDAQGVTACKEPTAAFGTVSMRQRALSSGGTLVIESAPGAGTRVITTWPNPTR